MANPLGSHTSHSTPGTVVVEITESYVAMLALARLPFKPATLRARLDQHGFQILGTETASATQVISVISGRWTHARATATGHSILERLRAEGPSLVPHVKVCEK